MLSHSGKGTPPLELQLRLFELRAKFYTKLNPHFEEFLHFKHKVMGYFLFTPSCKMFPRTKLISVR